MHFALYRESRSSAPPLKVGLLLDSPAIPRVFAEIIQHLVDAPYVSLACVLYNADGLARVLAPPRRNLAQRIVAAVGTKRSRSGLLYRLYHRWDRRQADPSQSPLAPVDCAALLNSIPSLVSKPITKRFVHRLEPSAIEWLRAADLDVLIRFGFNILRGDVLRVSRYGVWSFHHGDNDVYRGGPPCFWELHDNDPRTGVTLQVLTEQLDAGRVLCKGLFSTTHGLSYSRTVSRPYWGSTTFVIQKLKELHELGWDEVQRRMVQPRPYQGRRAIFTTPTNVEMVRWLVPAGLRWAVRRLAAPKVAHWRLGIRSRRPLLLESPTPQAVADGVRWIESPRNRYFADPFLIAEAGKRWAFFEDYDYRKRAGRISCAELTEGGLGPVRTALEAPYHLSYPCLVRSDGALYMVPESAEAGAVQAFRCTRFPDQWEFKAVLFAGRAVDTTVFQWQNRFWFFVTMEEPRAGATQLWLFSSSTLLGEWTSHPANPISTDVRNCRGAGAIVEHDGQIYRPSQDCSVNYGHSFALNRILALSKTEYREEPVVAVDPGWGAQWIGTHTYARLGDMEVIDGLARVRPDLAIGPS